MVVGLFLGDGKWYLDVVMENLIGDDMDWVFELLVELYVVVYLYGKVEMKLGCKMGYINCVVLFVKV